MVATRLPRRREAWLRIAAGVAAAVLLVVSVSVGAAVYGGVLLLLFVGVLAQVAAIPLALIRPWIAAPLSVAGALTIMISAHGGTAPWPWSVTTMIAQAFVLAFVGFRATAALGIGTLIGAAIFSGVLAPIVNPTRDLQAVAVDLIVFTSVAGVALAVGIVAREWGAIRDQLARERRTTEGERALRLVAEEKTRIARELHDVVAHSMSIITVQATSASVRHPQADAQTQQEFEEIAALSRRALTEMRSLLSVLREPDVPVARTPQPRLSEIPELVARSQRSGLSVRLLGADRLTDDGVDETVGLSAYRIVQEALSNVMRHTQGADVEVRVQRDGELDLTVTNRRGSGPATTKPNSRTAVGDGAGNGLLGMRERAASVGGTLAFGPTGDGGYEVHATLPLEPPEISSVER